MTVSRYGDAHVGRVDVHAELAGQALERDGDVRVADAAQHRLLGLLDALDASTGSSACRRCSARR